MNNNYFVLNLCERCKKLLAQSLNHNGNAELEEYTIVLHKNCEICGETTNCIPVIVSLGKVLKQLINLSHYDLIK